MICRGMRLLLIILTLKRPLEEKFGYIREHLSLWISQLEDVLQEVLCNGIETRMIFTNLPWYHCKFWHWLTLMMPVFTLPIMNKHKFYCCLHNYAIHDWSGWVLLNFIRTTYEMRTPPCILAAFLILWKISPPSGLFGHGPSALNSVSTSWGLHITTCSGIIGIIFSR